MKSLGSWWSWWGSAWLTLCRLLFSSLGGLYYLEYYIESLEWELEEEAIQLYRIRQYISYMLTGTQLVMIQIRGMHSGASI